MNISREALIPIIAFTIAGAVVGSLLIGKKNKKKKRRLGMLIGAGLGLSYGARTYLFLSSQEKKIQVPLAQEEIYTGEVYS